MLLKTINSKYTHMNKIFWLLFFSATIIQAQNVVVPDSTGVVQDNEELTYTANIIVKDTTVPFKRFKAEGISAVVGEYIILDTDIDKGYLEMKSQGISIEGVSRCQLLGK